MTTRLLLLCSFLCALQSLQAQCNTALSKIDLHANNIRARIANNGTLFSGGRFNPDPPSSGPAPSTIYTASLWLAGLDQNGNYQLRALDYSSGIYPAGPFTTNDSIAALNCTNWDRHFRVTAAEVAAFLAALPLSEAQAIDQFPSIMGWPVKGSTTFSSVWHYDLPDSDYELASFSDHNQNGVYEPLEGEYPVVQLSGQEPFLPTEIIWSVHNTRGSQNPNQASLVTDVQQTAWAFHTADHPVLNNTVFTSHKIIHRGPLPLDSVFYALWVDFDLGCYVDDYVGCNPDRNSMFAYNQDAVDGHPATTCDGGTATFTTPPVQTATLLNRSLNKIIAYNNANTGNPNSNTTDPSDPKEFYRYITGFWRDGSPITYGGSGYGGSIPTDFAFPGDPADPTAWSMRSANIPNGDRRMMGSIKIGRLLPGQTEELTTAWGLHYVPVSDPGQAMEEVDSLQAFYDAAFSGINSVITKAPFPDADSLELFPNPSSGDATLRYKSLGMEEIRIFDATGRHIQTLKNLPKTETTLRLGHLPNGIYTLSLMTKQGRVTKKLAIIR